MTDVQPASPEPGATGEPAGRPVPRRRRRRLRRVVAGLGVLVLIAIGGGAVFLNSAPFGASPSGERQARIERSLHWHDDGFVNARPQWLDSWSANTEAVFGGEDFATPDPDIEVAPTDTAVLAAAPVDGLRITWFGHSSTLVEVDGARILLDPLWSEYAGPTSLFGADRFFAAPAALDALGPIDAVLISHDHWDHLDQKTITAMRDWDGTTFVVPLGIGADLERWGIPADRIRELDWWESTTVASVELVATPSRHTSGRNPLVSEKTLWAGWAVRGPAHRVWYSGDSAFFPEIAEIGTRLGPFDVTLLDTGEYDPNWPDTHFGPELAVEVNELVGGRLLIPVHWGLLSLAPHNWTEPVERVRAESGCRDQPMLVLVPGVPTEPTAEAVAVQQQWWPSLPWRTAAEVPIHPTERGDPDDRMDIPSCVPGGR